MLQISLWHIGLLQQTGLDIWPSMLGSLSAMGPRTAGSRVIELLHNVKSKCKLQYFATSHFAFCGKHISLNRDSSGVYIFSDTAILGLAHFLLFVVELQSTRLQPLFRAFPILDIYLVYAVADQILPFNNISS